MRSSVAPPFPSHRPARPSIQLLAAASCLKVGNPRARGSETSAKLAGLVAARQLGSPFARPRSSASVRMWRPLVFEKRTIKVPAKVHRNA